MSNKRELGQFFTTEYSWLTNNTVDFIMKSKRKIIYDPFAGNGDIFSALKKIGNFKNIGLDIDPKLGWKHNDSLTKIPKVKGSIIVTNPPYLAKYSASRKKIDSKKYFNNTIYEDYYLIALEKMLEINDFVIAIVPETFLNSSFKKMHLIHSINIIENNPFSDTENPVCVVIFDSIYKDYDKIMILKNDKLLFTLDYLNKLKMTPNNSVKLKFNDPKGWLAIRAVDSTNSNLMLGFDYKKNIKYDWTNGIKISSRLFSLISVDIEAELRNKLIDTCNDILLSLRVKSEDLVFSPFKGNMENGRRRRRLDYKTARAIIEEAYQIVKKGTKHEQYRLF